MGRPWSIQTLTSADSMARFDPFQKMARDTSASAVLVGYSLSHEASRLWMECSVIPTKTKVVTLIQFRAFDALASVTRGGQSLMKSI